MTSMDGLIVVYFARHTTKVPLLATRELSFVRNTSLVDLAPMPPAGKLRGVFAASLLFDAVMGPIQHAVAAVNRECE